MREFRIRTPIALELIFAGWISLLAQYLAERGAAIRFGKQKIRLDLYTVVLAASGEMKTWSMNAMLRSIRPYWAPREAADSGSTAALLKHLQENDGKATLWRIEEFGEFFLELDNEAHVGTKRLMLMNYDGQPLARALKNEKINVKEPYLSIFGTTVEDNLSKQIKPEDWRSGLCQRIAFVRARPDPDPARQWQSKDFALLSVDEDKIGRAFRRITRTPVHQEYQFSAAAVREIKKCWTLAAQRGDQQFVRRIAFRALKYAVVHHVMLGKRGHELDAEDIAWAYGVAMLHLEDLRGILDQTEYADFEELLKRGEHFRQHCLAKGKQFRPGELQMRMARYIRGIQEARALYLLICERAHWHGAKDVPPPETIFEMTGHWPDYAPRAGRDGESPEFEGGCGS